MNGHHHAAAMGLSRRDTWSRIVLAVVCWCTFAENLAAATCYLKTGFDSGVYLALSTNTDVGYIKGRDSVTGYSFSDLRRNPSFIDAELGALGAIPEYIDFAITNMGGAHGNALSMQCFKTLPGGKHNTRVCYNLNFKKENPFQQGYVRFQMMLHPSFREAIRSAGGWMQIFEYKDYRLSGSGEQIHTLHVNIKRAGTNMYFSLGWRTIGPAREIWEVENRSIPVKFGEWFTVEMFLKPGTAGKGRFEYRIDGKEVFCITDKDIQYKNAPLHTWQIFKLYMDKTIIDWMRNNGTPCQAWYDNLEYWDDKPTGKP